jgi:hypothetical protein
MKAVELGGFLTLPLVPHGHHVRCDVQRPLGAQVVPAEKEHPHRNAERPCALDEVGLSGAEMQARRNDDDIGIVALDEFLMQRIARDGGFDSLEQLVKAVGGLGVERRRELVGSGPELLAELFGCSPLQARQSPVLRLQVVRPVPHAPDERRAATPRIAPDVRAGDHFERCGPELFAQPAVALLVTILQREHNGVPISAQFCQHVAERVESLLLFEDEQRPHPCILTAQLRSATESPPAHRGRSRSVTPSDLLQEPRTYQRSCRCHA